MQFLMRLMLQALKQEVQNFDSSDVNEFKRQMHSTIKSCDESSKKELNSILKGSFLTVNVPRNQSFNSDWSDLKE